jgi:hypothetical protein
METLTLQGVDTDVSSEYTEKIFKRQCQIIDYKMPSKNEHYAEIGGVF